MSPRILYFDIETFPLLSHTWSKWVDGSVVAIERDWTLASVAWQWEGDPVVQVRTAEGSPNDDQRLVDLLWDLFDAADIVVGHNGDGFDIKKVQARMLVQGYPPPSPFLSIDTLKILKSHFKLTSNRLGDACEALGLDVSKLDTGGWQLWADCLADDPEAWATMAEYNVYDVHALRALYMRIRPWMGNHPVVHDSGCPVCGSVMLQRRGTVRSRAGMEYQRVHCQECGAYSRYPYRSTSAEYRSAARK